MSLSSVNPANGKTLGHVDIAGAEEVDQALSAARKAQPQWARRPIEERIEIIQAYGHQLQESKEELASLISAEMGKPLWEARQEVAAMLGKIAISVKAHAERCPDRKSELPQARAHLRHKAHGVVAVYGPFNFPGHLPNGHIVPALIAGNTVIFKPSELVPLVAEKMIELWQKAGLPSGVLELVHGDADTGRYLSQHPGLDGLFFTGSSRTGCLLHEQYGRHPEKILALEMGGNNPLIVAKTTDLKATAYQIIQSAYITSGQRCTCARRLILTEDVPAAELIQELCNWIDRLRIGSYDSDPEPFMGPVASAAAASQLIQAQSQLIDLGGKLITEMRQRDKELGFLTPGLIDMTGVQGIPDQENFGPLLQVKRVASLDEAIHLANDTAYGLSAGLLSEDVQQYEEFFARIRAGIVNWNTQTTGASSQAPFGGVGISGNHHPSAYYAADYCSYPVASLEVDTVKLPENLSPGINA
jgi:succinylglutamic semialdehyde dehydrogenase